jgi:hypothetical protein
MHFALANNMPEVALELANPSRYAGVFSQRDSSGYCSNTLPLRPTVDEFPKMFVLP